MPIPWTQKCYGLEILKRKFDYASFNTPYGQWKRLCSHHKYWIRLCASIVLLWISSLVFFPPETANVLSPFKQITSYTYQWKKRHCFLVYPDGLSVRSIIRIINSCLDFTAFSFLRSKIPTCYDHHFSVNYRQSKQDHFSFYLNYGYLAFSSS